METGKRYDHEQARMLHRELCLNRGATLVPAFATLRRWRDGKGDVHSGYRKCEGTAHEIRQHSNSSLALSRGKWDGDARCSAITVDPPSKIHFLPLLFHSFCQLLLCRGIEAFECEHVGLLTFAGDQSEDLTRCEW